MQDKMSDFAIILKPDPRQEKAINNVLRDMTIEKQSINQSLYTPLREQPLLWTMETKLPWSGGETSTVQLAIWSVAGLARMRELLERGQNAGEPIPTIPAISMHGYDYHLQAFKEEQENDRVVR